MNLRLYSGGSVLVAFCVTCTALLSSGAAPAQQPKDAIPALFDGIPADLRAKVKFNSVRRDRVNDWLGEHVNGKGKTIEMQIPVKVVAQRVKDGTYLVVVYVGSGSGVPVGKASKGGLGGGFQGFSGPKVTALGDEWLLDLVVGAKDSVEYWPNQLELSGVSAADAEKLVDLTEATVKGKIQEVGLVNANILRLALADVHVDGKKMNLRKREPTGKASKSSEPAK